MVLLTGVRRYQATLTVKVDLPVREQAQPNHLPTEATKHFIVSSVLFSICYQTLVVISDIHDHPEYSTEHVFLQSAYSFMLSPIAE